jgi:hypothetical protein
MLHLLNLASSIMSIGTRTSPSYACHDGILQQALELKAKEYPSANNTLFSETK